MFLVLSFQGDHSGGATDPMSVSVAQQDLLGLLFGAAPWHLIGKVILSLSLCPLTD